MLLLPLLACAPSPVVRLDAPEEGGIVRVGEPLTFVAAVSDDDPLDTLRYALTADPGGELDHTDTFSQDRAELLFTRSLLPGPVRVTLVVTDPGGGTGRDSVNLVVVENAAPTVGFVRGASTVAAGVPLELAIQAADADEADASALTLAWVGAVGPDHPDAGGGAAAIATFATVGPASVSVTVTDPEGALAIADLALDVYDADADDDGFADVADGGTDCDDADPTVSPAATEVCDGVDQDCDGVTDDGPSDGATWYPDADGDGWGSDVGEPSCAAPEGWLATAGDCDDADAAVSPDAVETCDGVDQDCDGAVDDDALDATEHYYDDDGDGWGDASAVVLACEGDPGTVSTGGDCDDTDAAVSPSAAEACDPGNVDEDCDGLADDADSAPSGRTAWYADTDGDGYGWWGTTRTTCDAPAGYVADATDCDDGAAAAYPGAVEVCEDGLDNDCDGAESTCTLAGSIGLADGDTRWDGVSANDFAGAVAAAGDQDGDGLPDLVIGAWGRNGGGSGSGAIYVVSGLDAGGSLSGALATRTGVAASDAAGYAVAGVGDLDGDGWDDLAVGAYGTDGGGSGSGGAYVVSGPVSGTASLSTADATLVGESAGDAAGWSVAAAGDTDGDGFPELLVGATGNDGGGTVAGRAYLLEGPLAGTVDLSAADALLTGDVASDLAGYAVAGVGDTDGDGFDDLLVGGTGTSSGAGAAWLLLGPVSGSVDLGAADATLAGAAASDAAGACVAPAGDTDGDGYADVLVGAPLADAAGADAGAAYLVRGPVADGSLSAADAVLTGGSAQDRAGTALRGGGDPDGDGYADLLVGAYADATAGTGAGAVYLLYGPISGTIALGGADATLLGEAARDAAGRHVAFAGDTDGDGFDDVLVGATGRTSSAGAVYLVLGGGG